MLSSVHPHADPPTVAGAIDRVVDAAQHVVVDEVRLVRLEAQELLAVGSRGVAMLTGAALFLALAWIAALATTYVLLEGHYTPAQRLVLIAVVNAALGCALAIVGSRRLSSIETNWSHDGSRRGA
jgi:Zn-dependent protease